MSAIHLIESFEISSEVMVDTVIFKLHLGFVRASKYVGGIGMRRFLTLTRLSG